METVQRVLVYYPAGIVIFGALCQALVYVPSDERQQSPLITSKAEQTPPPTKTVDTVSQQQTTSQDLPAPPNAQSQNPPTTVPSRNTVWFATFWLLLQLYSILRMGSSISVAEQEQPGLVWPAMISLFFTTFMTLMSIVRLDEALQRAEAYQKVSTGAKERYFLNVEMLVLMGLLVFVPWVQAGWVVVMG